MGCCCSDCCCDKDDSPQNFQDKRAEHHEMKYPSAVPEDQGMRYPSTTAHQTATKTGTNDYHTQILNLPTLHQNFMYEVRRYQISVYRGRFAEHHFIVVSDGVHEDITLELTVIGDKKSVLSGQEKVVAAVNIFRGDMNDLDKKGVVECTLHMLTEIAANILRRNPYYNLISNNCQDFCNKFLNELKQQTYMTDPQIGTGIATGVAASFVIGSRLAAGSR